METKVKGMRSLVGGLVTILTVLVIAPIPENASSYAQERRQQPKQFVPPPAQPSGGSTATPNVIVSPDEDYRIGPSDIIEIGIQDAPELSGTFRVNAAGTFFLPFLGSITTLQKTPEELGKVIADGLRSGYLTNPQVTVTVKQINSRSFFIQGAVRRPGLYQIEGRPSLLKLITIAGGLSDNYGSSAFIMREIKQAKDLGGAVEADRNTDPAADRGAAAKDKTSAITDSQTPATGTEGEPTYELVKASINSLLRGNFNQNLLIEPGDIVHIPPTDLFFVAGEVNAPGSFQLKDSTTLRQAISLAQGTNFNAATGKGIIFREDPTSGKRQEIRVDIAAVMSGKKEDIPVTANDIIIVPNSRLKSVTGTMLRVFGASAPRVLLRTVN